MHTSPKIPGRITGGAMLHSSAWGMHELSPYHENKEEIKCAVLQIGESKIVRYGGCQEFTLAFINFQGTRIIIK